MYNLLGDLIHKRYVVCVGTIFDKVRLQNFRKMETYNLIIAGTIGSVITLFFTAVFDYLKRCIVPRWMIVKLYFKEESR